MLHQRKENSQQLRMNKIYYVYFHHSKTTNQIFYIGKGKRNRAYSLSGRNARWYEYVKQNGFEPKIMFDNLTAQEAFNLEIKMINKHKSSGHLLNIVGVDRLIQADYVVCDEPLLKPQINTRQEILRVVEISNGIHSIISDVHSVKVRKRILQKVSSHNIQGKPISHKRIIKYFHPHTKNTKPQYHFFKGKNSLS